MSSFESLHAEFNSRENMIKLIYLICQTNNLDYSNKQVIHDILIFLKSLDGRAILEKNSTIEKSNQSIAELYDQKLKNNKSLADNLDEIHSYLTNIIKLPGNEPLNYSKAYRDTLNNDESTVSTLIKSFNNSVDEQEKIEFIKFLNYKSIWRDTYIIVDSRYQNVVNTDRTKISFNLQTNSKIRADHGGIIVGNAIRDIVEVEIYPFTIPYKPLFANFYKRITLTIEEWTANSFEAYENGAFHFVFDIVRIDDNLIHLSPVNSKFSFIKPMNYIDNFTLSFGAMLPKIEFDIDRMYVSSIDYTSDEGIFIFSEPHNLVTGDLVYVTGFSSLDIAKDVEVIEEINRSSGHIIVKKDNYSIILNVDISTMRHEDPIGSNIYPIDTFYQTPLIYFASKRIQIPMKITYLLPAKAETVNR